MSASSSSDARFVGEARIRGQPLPELIVEAFDHHLACIPLNPEGLSNVMGPRSTRLKLP